VSHFLLSLVGEFSAAGHRERQGMALAKQFRLTGYHLLENRRKKNLDFGLFPGGMAVARRSIN
jgi:hypothetical protein